MNTEKYNYDIDDLVNKYKNKVLELEVNTFVDELMFNTYDIYLTKDLQPKIKEWYCKDWGVLE